MKGFQSSVRLRRLAKEPGKEVLKSKCGLVQIGRRAPRGGPAAVPVRVMATQPWAGPSQVKHERGRMSRRGGEYWESESVSRSVVSDSL